MVTSNALTVADYLAELPPERRVALEKVRQVILKHLPPGYEEAMQYGMIGYIVPLKIYPAGYLNNPAVPLCYAGVASQKNYMSLYLMNVYADPATEQWFVKEYAKTGHKLNMGKSCLRFKRIEDLPLELIGKAIARTSVKDYINLYEQSRRRKT